MLLSLSCQLLMPGVLHKWHLILSPFVPPIVFLQLAVRSFLSMMCLTVVSVYSSSWLFCELDGRSTHPIPLEPEQCLARRRAKHRCVWLTAQRTLWACGLFSKFLSEADVSLRSTAVLQYFPLLFPSALPTSPACIIHSILPALLRHQCAPRNIAEIVFLSFTILSQIMAL